MEVFLFVAVLLLVVVCITSIAILSYLSYLSRHLSSIEDYLSIQKIILDKLDKFTLYYKQQESKTSSISTTSFRDILTWQSKFAKSYADSTDKLIEICSSNTECSILPESKILESTESHRYYLVCLCTRLNQSKFIRCFTSDHYVEGDLSYEDLKSLQNKVLDANPDYQSCEILFFNRIK